MKLKKYFLFLLVAIAFTSVTMAQDTTSTENTAEDFTLDPGDGVVQMLDNLARQPYLEMSRFDTSRATLNTYGFSEDSVPTYDSAYYAAFLDSLDKRSPFDLVYNSRTEAFINLYVVKRRSTTEKLLGLQHQYFPMMEELLAKHEMPFELKYLSVIESGLNPRARSKAGAVGLWQFMYTTGKMYGLHQNSYMDERMDPIKSTEAALKYLKYLYNIYHKWDLALAAYNCGPGNVNRAMRRAGSKDGNYWDLYPYLPRETRGYVPAFIAVNYVMNNPSAHNLYPIMPLYSYFETDTVNISKPISFDQLSEMLDMPVDEIADYNPSYKLNYIPAYSNKTSVLCLPYEKAELFVQNEDKIYAQAEKKSVNTGNEIKPFTEERVVYTVRSGDYLGKIADRYKVSITNIKRWNGLSNNNLRIGQKLVLYPSGNVTASTPKPTPKVTTSGNYQYYEVQSGDTLWDIANAKGVSVEQLKEWNSNLTEKDLKIGTKIIVGTS